MIFPLEFGGGYIFKLLYYCARVAEITQNKKTHLWWNICCLREISLLHREISDYVDWGTIAFFCFTSFAEPLQKSLRRHRSNSFMRSILLVEESLVHLHRGSMHHCIYIITFQLVFRKEIIDVISGELPFHVFLVKLIFP